MSTCLTAVLLGLLVLTGTGASAGAGTDAAPAPVAPAPVTTGPVAAGPVTAGPAPVAARTTAGPRVVARPRPACGPRVRKSDGTLWRCTFADDFSGRRLDRRKWLAVTTRATDYRIGPECYVDSPDSVAVRRGALHLTVRATRRAFTCRTPNGSFSSRHTAGTVSTFGRFTQSRGRFEIRAAFPTTRRAGTHSALWLWPRNPLAYGAWPLSGEIDVAEFFSVHPDRAIPYLHYLPGSPTAAQTMTRTSCRIRNPSRFHTYVLVWSPRRIRIVYDGRTCLDHRIQSLVSGGVGAPFDRPFTLNLTQGLGVGVNAFDPATTRLPATMRIDHVRVWR